MLDSQLIELLLQQLCMPGCTKIMQAEPNKPVPQFSLLQPRGFVALTAVHLSRTFLDRPERLKISSRRAGIPSTSWVVRFGILGVRVYSGLIMGLRECM